MATIPLPNLPTDSLYKFQAMAGLWLFVGSIVGMEVLLSYSEEQFTVTERDVALVGVDAERLKSDSEEFQQRFGTLEELRSLRDRMTRGELSQSERERAQADSVEALTHLRDHSQRTDLLQKKNIEQHAGVRRLEHLVRLQRRMRVIGIAFAIVGAALSALGFRSWAALQRKTDRLLDGRSQSPRGFWPE